MLVVEDEKRLAAGLRNGLEADGFAVDVALNGTDGLWLATEEPYDAIVLDIMLPGLQRLPRSARRSARSGNWTPILMLTAKDGEFDEAEALDTGADDYLTKPFSYRRARGAAAGPAPPRAHASGRRCSRPATCALIPRRVASGAGTSRSR